MLSGLSQLSTKTGNQRPPILGCRPDPCAVRGGTLAGPSSAAGLAPPIGPDPGLPCYSRAFALPVTVLANPWSARALARRRFVGPGCGDAAWGTFILPVMSAVLGCLRVWPRGLADAGLALVGWPASLSTAAWSRAGTFFFNNCHWQRELLCRRGNRAAERSAGSAKL